ncbi:hypothetical protein [Pleionea sediminis]|uniref:hypothetical protein n=1 Tax=Pleionea sediminis TaxID=2569479 RepID=UPI001186F625|nr:hypothetical protein [Pleionea sediminis]
MSLSINTGLVEEWFVLPGQENEADPAKFKLKPLNQLNFMEVSADTIRYRNGKLKPSGEAYGLALGAGLVGWDNILDQSGQPLPFSIDNLAYIPAHAMMQVFERIYSISDLSEDDEKNS